MSANSSLKESFQQERLKNLFKKLDLNGDGLLEPEELESAVKELRLPHKDIQSVVNNMDSNKDQRISFEEFQSFVLKREQELFKVFSSLDTNKDGYLDESEVYRAIISLSQQSNTTQQDIHNLMKRIDANADGHISFEEWVDLLSLVPEANVASILDYWRDATLLDDVDGPSGSISVLSKGLNSSKALLAGALAGAVSRTSTAPLERLKLMLIVQTKKTPNMWIVFKEMYHDGGLRGLFRGNGVNILKAAPEKALKYAIFEHMKGILANTTTDGELKNWHMFVAGSVAGVACHSLLFPLEVIKTRLSVAPTGEYSGMIDAMTKIAKHEGYIKPFFRGLTPNIVGTVWSSGFSLMSYEALKDLMFGKNPSTPPSVTGLMICGGASSLVGQVLFYPLHVVKTRLIMQGAHQLNISKLAIDSNLHGQVKTAKHYNGMVDAFVKIAQHEGPMALFKGFLPNLVKSVPAHGITFGVYEAAKRILGFEEHKKHKH